MAILHKSLVKEVASNKPNASTAFNLPDSAPTGYRSFDSAYATNDQCPYFATNGTAWESGIGTFTAGTPDTLARTTVLESSTGSAIDFSSGGDVTVEVQWTAFYAEMMTNPGAVIVRNDGSTTQSIPANTFTKLTSCISSEVKDNRGWYNTSTSQFQPTIPGIYAVIVGIQIAIVNNGKSVIAIARKNGTDYAHLARGYVATVGNVGVSGACLVDMNGSSDYIEPYCWHNDTVSESTVAGSERCFFMAYRVSDL